MKPLGTGVTRVLTDLGPGTVDVHGVTPFGRRFIQELCSQEEAGKQVFGLAVWVTGNLVIKLMVD